MSEPRAVMLNDDQIEWLRSQARMRIRKTLKVLVGLAPKEGQSEADFVAFATKKNEDLKFQLDTLTALGQDPEFAEFRRQSQLARRERERSLKLPAQPLTAEDGSTTIGRSRPIGQPDSEGQQR